MKRAIAQSGWVVLFLFLCAGIFAGVVHRRAVARHRAEAARVVTGLPPRMLWVWERPEDLRGIDVSHTGVAILEQTLRIGTALAVIPRRQPVVLPRGVMRMAVVRIETEDSFAAHRDGARLLNAAVADLVTVASEPGIAALEIDFDARRSERGFYRQLLEKLRARMPAAMPLNITALVSWCSTDDWIADLPVNEATPMFFRMEPDRRRVVGTEPEYRVREPLCMSSVGVSTREPWPPDIRNKRIYIFAEHGWTKELAVRQGSVPAVTAGS